MDVVHLNTFDISGGAARAAYRLHSGLCSEDIDSSMYVLEKSSDEATVDRFIPPADTLSGVRRRFRKWRIEGDMSTYDESRPSGLEPFSDDRTMYGAQVVDSMPDCDVINLHWIAGFVDVGAFLEKTTQPVVWTLHDQNPFTGGCHYDYGCKKFTAKCGACPQLGSSDVGGLSRQIWKRKQTACQRARDRIHVVAPSRWLGRMARQSSLFGEFPVSVIPYGVDTEIFAPFDTAGLRRAMGISSDEQVLLFVAESTSNQRKGFSLLLEAVEEMSIHDNVHLLSVGATAPEVDAPVPHHHLGKITNDRLLAAIYACADLFVIPSRQDNLPNTVLESMACGTPVVGFKTGGIPDMVRPRKTGLLAETGNVRELREAIESLIRSDDARQKMSQKCREVAVNEYALQVQATQYQDLYARMISSEKAETVSPSRAT